MASQTTLAFQPPPGPLFETYNLSLSASSPLQPPTIPQTLKDSLSLREHVFVNEQRAVPLQHHIDRDDARSCHWVLYSNSTPIGTIRLAPPPQYPHPEPGARFEAPGPKVPAPDPKVLFNAPLPEWVVDRKTDLHDGVESFVKLGRLCLLKEYRGNRLADLLIQEALGWARKEENREVVGGEGKDGREWKGLVCVHARIEAMKTWARNGFVLDKGMGTWFEAGIPHVGMFYRLGL